MPRPTDRTRIHRHPERAEEDPAVLRRILDDALTCTVAWVDPDGRPRALPTIHARIDDTLYLHGSRAARAWKTAAGGADLCVVATVVDELVLARTSPHHSMNYRSAVVFGRGREVMDRDELYAVARAITRHVLPGREDETVTVPKGFDPSAVRLTGNVRGEPPFKGTLRHAGWRATAVNIPERTGLEPKIVAPAEVELS